MIDTLKKMILPAIVAVVVTLVVLVGSQSAKLGGNQIETFPTWFYKGLYGGTSKVQIVDSSGNVVAPIVSTGAISGTTGTLTGLLTGLSATFSSTLNVVGNTTVELFTQGGGVLSTSTVSTAMVPTAATFNYGLIEVTPLVADLTYTFPASSTMSAMIPNAGDMRVVTVYNATTTAGIDVIFAAGTGMEIKTVGTASAINVDEASFATLTFVRKANSDILVLMATPLDD
jgi:hypothetical protein